MKIPIHPIADLFPPIDDVGLKELAERIKKNGQQEKGVIFEAKLLDGRNRQDACAMNGIAFQTVRWEDLPKELTKNGPLEYVFDRNAARRHLTTSQRSAVAAEYAEMLEEQAKAGNGAKAGSSANLPPKPGTRGGGKTTTAAAKKFGVSPRSVQAAKTLKKKSPKKFAKVKAGKGKLSKEAKSLSKTEKANQAHEANLRRIFTVAGKNLADAARKGSRLKGRKEVAAFAALSDADMKRTQPLIEDGWPVKKAAAYKAKALNPAHKLSDLIDRATSEGGKFDCEVSGWTISIRRTKKD